MAPALDAAVASVPQTRRPVCVSRYDRDDQATDFLQLGGLSLGDRFAAELRGSTTDLHGSGARFEYARGPSGSGEAPRLPDGRWAAGSDVDACVVLAGSDACRARRPAGRSPRLRRVAERGVSAGVGVRPRRSSSRPERQHACNGKRGLALVRAGAGRAGQRPGSRAARGVARRPCRRTAGSFSRSLVRGGAGRGARRACQAHAGGSRRLDAGVGAAGGPGNDQCAARSRSAGECRVASPEAVATSGTTT